MGKIFCILVCILLEWKLLTKTSVHPIPVFWSSWLSPLSRIRTGSRWWLTERRACLISWTLQVRRSTVPWGISTWGQGRASSVSSPSTTPSPLRTFTTIGEHGEGSGAPTKYWSRCWFQEGTDWVKLSCVVLTKCTCVVVDWLEVVTTSHGPRKATTKSLFI